MVDLQSLTEEILRDINAVSVSADPVLMDYANELAAGVTAEREAEIAEALPAPYTLEESATAELGSDKIRVPRMTVVQASRAGDEEWITSASGRRMRRSKADCVVGYNVVADTEWYAVVKFAILWRRDKS